MTHTPFLPLILPLIAGILILLAKPGGIKLQRTLAITATTILVAASLYVMQSALQNPPQIYALGNWKAPFGIVLVLDQLSAFMVLITSLLAAAALWFAIRQNTDKEGAHFHVLFQIQLFGINGAFLTGDLFNLFVFFEVLLLASYGLLLHGGGRLKTRAGLHYVAINLIGSTLFLFAVGALYGILGTLNMADLAQKIALLPASEQGVVATAGLMLFVVFGVKAAMFPLYLWLPQAYANTSAPVAALFAIMTKVGIYAILRVHGLLFGDTAGDLAGLHIDWLLWLGLVSMAFAAFGVIAAKNLRQQVAYLVLASVATLLVAIGINTEQALSAALFYLIHSTFIAGGLFLLADYIRQGRGHVEDAFVRAHAMPSAILIGSVFIFAALAISGMPPLSGFLGKFLILQSALDHPAFWWILGVVLTSSLLIIIALARSGSLLFYNILPQEESHAPDNTQQNNTGKINMQGCGSIIGLLSVGAILVLFAQPIYNVTDSIAQQLNQPQIYLQNVLQFTPVENTHKELVE
ncbi:monovalent cation/H+ antiporter subunit D [Thiomicrorhabdus xiamenensis]|uniref:Monovalent cation/H+ antiporter subunit D n=1 Tax=Thiomicrorhabdus xiamenensis TaxID=2739063 RepID=A0A7D4NNZ5_9GAMM|nr:monovalent cation/H+ antiporter subunit D [Thiomicrorhabdus xiamenensis]QKI88071.1 monovalent cation/H+ antiporter subunit D [Thiomicrorhabdus xiamenensis]